MKDVGGGSTPMNFETKNLVFSLPLCLLCSAVEASAALEFLVSENSCISLSVAKARKDRD